MKLLSAAFALAMLSSSVLAADQSATPPQAPSQGSDAKGGDAKTGTSPPVQAGGAGVQGKSDAGSGQTKKDSNK